VIGGKTVIVDPLLSMVWCAISMIAFLATYKLDGYINETIFFFSIINIVLCAVLNVICLIELVT